MLKLINAAEYSTKLKATIQQTGKLGFTKETIDALDLNEQKSIQFAEDDTRKNTLFMIVYDEQNEAAFRVNKAGDYLYLNTKVFFELRGYDFKEWNFMFDLYRAEEHEAQIPNARIFRMEMRKTKRNKGDSNEPADQS